MTVWQGSSHGFISSVDVALIQRAYVCVLCVSRQHLPLGVWFATTLSKHPTHRKELGKLGSWFLLVVE